MNNLFCFEAFFVGLLEGDGCIYMRKNRQNKTYPVFVISLQSLPENEALLNEIQLHLGGSIQYEKATRKHKGKVIWVGISKKTIRNCLTVLKKYPLLTSRKQCQLLHLYECLNNNDWAYHLQQRDFRYANQKQLIDKYNKVFKRPAYFESWLSGFIEAEGCFRSTNRLSFYICQNDDWYILNAIKEYFDSHHKLGVNKDSRPRKTNFCHYRLSISGKKTLENVITHVNIYPLLGYKKISYSIFYDKFKDMHYTQ